MTSLINHHKFFILTLTLLAGLGFALALPALAQAGQSGRNYQAPAANHIIYVAKTGNGSDGSSWANAYTDLQDALTVTMVTSGDEIWVATGVYTPGTTVSDTFQLFDEVKLYGGFDPASGADEFAERDWDAFPTVLSGDIGGDDVIDAYGVVITTTNIVGNNAYHVVTGSGVTTTAVLDGFIITAGQADGGGDNYYGGGMYNLSGSPTLARLTFSGNSAGHGGGMYNQDSSPLLTDVTFSGNAANSNGGGIFNTNNSNPLLSDTMISGNSANIGGGMSNGSSNPELTNVIVIGNSGYWGGGLTNSGGNPILSNVSLSGNSASIGGGMYNLQGSNPTLSNVSLSGNSASNGGGMYNQDSNLELINVTISGNLGSDGAGISNSWDSTLELTNVTISGNRASSNGGGMYNGDNIILSVRNSILWYNQDSSGVGTLNATIYNDNSSTITLTHSLAQGTGGSGSWTSDPSFVNGGNNLDSDPLFIQVVDPTTAPTTNGNLRLMPSSPAINAGDNQSVTVSTDLDGKLRIVNGVVDIGAYENRCPGGSILYVNQGLSSAGDGGSWTEAYTDLQEALSVSSTCSGVSQIWAATGVYYPGTTQSDTFHLLDDVALYGGFDPASGVLQFMDRDWTAHPTVLSGDIDGNDSTDSNGVVATTTNISGANSYHVVTGSGVTTTAVLNGFTITAGQANGGRSENNGGGMYTNNGYPTLEQVAFSGNFAEFAGGGMYNIGSSPVLTDVIFSGNAADYGGGMYNEYSNNPTLNNASLSGNSAISGGGMYNYFSNPELTNVTLSGNAANSAGGGIYNNNGSILNVRNSILWHNQDSSGSGTLTATVYNDSSAITLTHSIAQGTGDSASWTTDPSFVDGGENLDSDPLFIQVVDPTSAPTTSGNLRLQPTSPAINAGEDQYVTGIPTDLDGNSRISGGTVDMGAYEFQFYSLDLSLAGSGSGSVSSTPAGIDCAAGSTESDCTEIYADGTVVTLTASADSGSIFAGWNGACKNTSGDCVVTMAQDQTVTATFNRTSTAVYLPLVSR